MDDENRKKQFSFFCSVQIRMTEWTERNTDMTVHIAKIYYCPWLPLSPYTPKCMRASLSKRASRHEKLSTIRSAWLALEAVKLVVVVLATEVIAVVVVVVMVPALTQVKVMGTAPVIKLSPIIREPVSAGRESIHTNSYHPEIRSEKLR